jgi:hypothetical protein
MGMDLRVLRTLETSIAEGLIVTIVCLQALAGDPGWQGAKYFGAHPFSMRISDLFGIY